MSAGIARGVFPTRRRPLQVGTSAHEKGGFRNTAVIGKLAVPVSETFPWIHCRQVGWAQRGDVPLQRGQIGHSGHADPAVAPGLPSQPRDEIATVLGLAPATVPKLAFGVPAPARVGIDNRIAVLTPIGGIGSLETGVTGDPARGDIGFRPYQAFRRVVFSVGAPSEKDRKSTRLNSSHTIISYAGFCLKKKKPVSRARCCAPPPRPAPSARAHALRH